MRSLSARILLGFFALMVAFGTFVVTIVWNLREVEDQASLILQGYVPLTMALTDLAQREDDLRQHLDQARVETSTLASLRKGRDEAMRVVVKQLEELRGLVTSSKTQQAPD